MGCVVHVVKDFVNPTVCSFNFIVVHTRFKIAATNFQMYNFWVSSLRLTPGTIVDGKNINLDRIDDLSNDTPQQKLLPSFVPPPPQPLATNIVENQNVYRIKKNSNNDNVQ